MTFASWGKTFFPSLFFGSFFVKWRCFVTDKVFVIRGCVSLFARRQSNNNYTVSFLFQSSRKVVSFLVNREVLACLKLLDGEHRLGDISTLRGVPPYELKWLVQRLKKEGILEEIENVGKTVNNSVYQRQLNFFSSFEVVGAKSIDFHKRLKSAKVVILGIGGIGTWVAELLARSGVGQLTLIDPDLVETSNLPRQALFSLNDVGRSKVWAAGKRLRALNQELRVKTAKKLVSSPEVLVGLVNHNHLVINCSDYPDVSVTNDIVSKACFCLGLPHILCGGYDGHLSFVGQTVIPHQTSCWNCYTSSQIYEKSLRGFKHIPITRSSLEGVTLAPVASLTASIHALEAVRIITGYDKPVMRNRKAEIDFSSLSINFTNIPRRKDCRLCGKKRSKGVRR